MGLTASLTDQDVEQALAQWDDLRRDVGPDAAEAFVRSLPAGLREGVERDVRLMLAAEQALMTPAETGEEIARRECGAMGVSGRYEIVGVLAIGGMGVVYRARDLELRREVAYKVMKRRYREDPNAERRFLQEAQVTAEFRHPGIVPVLGFVRDGCGLPAYAMEVVEGLTLGDAIGQLRLPPAGDDPRAPASQRRIVLRHFVSACRTIAYAHEEMRCVHGDLKPSNILIDRYDGTRVVDWGVCRFVSPEDAPPEADADAISRRIVTRQFGGPSAGQAGEPATFESDIHALGATLYNLLTGRPPSADLEWSTVPIPKPLAAVCRKAMASSRQDRYSSVALLADDVEAYLEDTSNSVYADPWMTRLRRWFNQHQTSAVAALLTFLFLCVSVTGAVLAWDAIERDARRARESFEKAARHEADRVRFESERRTLNTMLHYGLLEYMATNRRRGIQLYDELVRTAQDRLNSEFRSDADVAILAQALAYRGLIELPAGFLGHETSASPMADALKKLAILILAGQPIDGELIASLTPPLDPERARKAEPWLKRSLEKFRCINATLHPDSQDYWVRHACLTTLIPLLLKESRFTEALLVSDEMIAIEGVEAARPWLWRRNVIRMAAEVEQSKQEWSRPPRAYDPRVMRMTGYLAEDDAASYMAIYNAACVFSLASSDERATSRSRELRAARAITYLRWIADRGYFRDPKRRMQLLNDTDLNPLRHRHDFQAIADQAQARR
ncbi:Serine/threonine-protein kinase PknB [Aquisphaera giovannonii]|uniref:Serine/threonine-protein kinase PknB n=1 Tax=Aquisphaera giovannonii TaxID=406548 RepID=A0A5B9W6Q7_9BACT|nr:serine/threonine-protein kinase [Aquisphaera giovannonii]QEH35660.1 Serine/threonine-protein kinase PknB [Aquisphaera giovannonii]